MAKINGMTQFMKYNGFKVCLCKIGCIWRTRPDCKCCRAGRYRAADDNIEFGFFYLINCKICGTCRHKTVTGGQYACSQRCPTGVQVIKHDGTNSVSDTTALIGCCTSF